jgi:hypothetical protein
MSRSRGMVMFLVLSCILCSAVGGSYFLDWYSRPINRRPTLSHKDVMERFRARNHEGASPV